MVSFGYTILRIFVVSSQLLVFLRIGDMIAGLGLWLGVILAVVVLVKAVQYFKLLKSSMMQKQQVHFGEHRIEVREDKGNISCYPYASILFTEITKYQVAVYMKRIGNVKSLLTFPASAFTGDGEMEFCVKFLQQKQLDEAEMDPLKQQAEVTSLQEKIFTFAFIQEEAEWIDALAAQKYYLTHSKYVFRTSEGIVMTLFFLIVAWMGVIYYIRDRYLLVLGIYSILIILLFVMVYQIQFSRRAVLRNARLTAKRGFPVPRRTGRQAITFNDAGIYYSSDSEQWNMAYERIIAVVKTSREVFIFMKSGYFLNIPVWVFQSEEEEQQVLDYLEKKGISVVLHSCINTSGRSMYK